MRALVVDDDWKISSLVEKGLREAGIPVDAVAHGPDPLNLTCTTPYTLRLRVSPRRTKLPASFRLNPG
jgi:DNA-binding response OmpR family regulator